MMNELPIAEQLLQTLPIDHISISTTNPRQSFDPAGLTELAASIAEVGIQVPLLVRRIYNPEELVEHVRFQLVAGERRLRAAKQLGLTEVPCLVRDMTDMDARETQIVENLQRADVHPVEEAEAYRQLIVEAEGWRNVGATGLVGVELTAGDVAKRVGKSVSYVAQRLKLLGLEPVIRQMFLEKYVTLEHALIVAKLTPVDQDRVTRQLLQGEGDHAKMATPEVFAARKKNIATNDWAKHSRMVDMTEGELKQWVGSNVLLQLKTAPWALEDAKLVATAGACTTCPKRSGSNAALFADLTPEQDVCLDGACFSVKHKAFVQLTTRKAEEAGEPLLKLTTKSGYKKLPDEVGEKIVFKNGQWLKAKAKSCPAVRRGILIDSSSQWSGDKLAAGDIITVCVNQRCKEHKHTVEAIVASGNSAAAKSESWEVRQARENAEEAALEAKEKPILRAVYDALLQKVTPSSLYLQSLILSCAVGYASEICAEMGIAYAAPKAGKVGDRLHDDAAAPALKAWLMKATNEQLHRVSFHALMIDGLSPSGWSLRQKAKSVREKLWEAARFLEVDAAAIAKAASAKPAKPMAEKKAPAPKVVPAKKPVPRKLSPAARKTIAANMKKRWSAARAKSAGGKKVAAK